jgi:isopentenyl-diphosphate delta-isomerase
MIAEEQVILVDENDEAIGEMNKLAAHQQGKLHRAFSVLLFNTSGQMLLQQRAASKYHSPLLWSNACCSHPKPGEEMIDAVNRRLIEEIGIQSQTEFSHRFHYKIEFENGLVEHELDHVFIGTTDLVPIVNPDEVEAFRYIELNTLRNDMKQHPDQYTFWFHLIMKELKS